MADKPQPPDVQATTTALGAGLSRIAVGQFVQANADLNAQPPPLSYDPITRQAYYTTAPVPVKRLFGSPLALKGPHMRGAVRGIDYGWTANHRALEYPVTVAEAVLAMGDGTVVFAGFQSKSVGLVNVEYARADAQGNIVAQDGTRVRDVADVGQGGICIHVLHSGDFEGYRTEYYNLGSVDVSAIAPANRVVEGQTIGKAGSTGGPTGHNKTRPMLALQVAFVSGTVATLVPPTSLAPNAWPGHPDSTTGAGISSNSILMPNAPFGVQVAANTASIMLAGADRGVSLENQGTTALRQAQARHATFIQQSVNQRLGTLYAASAAFKAQPNTTVTGPMVFDFERGVWVINGIDQGPV